MKNVSKKLSAFLLLTLTLTTSAFAHSEMRLTKVDRGTCLELPEPLSFEEQVNGVHYRVNTSYVNTYRCTTDFHGNQNCPDLTNFIATYIYKEVSKIDFYNYEGKLITTKVSSEKVTVERSDDRGSDRNYIGTWKEVYELDTAIPQDDMAKSALKEMIQELNEEVQNKVKRIVHESDYPVCDENQ